MVSGLLEAVKPERPFHLGVARPLNKVPGPRHSKPKGSQQKPQRAEKGGGRGVEQAGQTLSLQPSFQQPLDWNGELPLRVPTVYPEHAELSSAGQLPQGEPWPLSTSHYPQGSRGTLV